MTKAILFDVDGVLLDSFEANFKFYQNLMIKNGYTPPTREIYQKLFATPMRDVVKTLTQSTSEEEIDRIWKMGRKRETGYPMELLTLPPNAETTIQKLSQQYTLGIVTSRVRENIYESPALKALSSYFQVVIAFADTVNHKPHPEPLLLAAQKLGVAPDECIYVGDAVTDLQAGHAAGMKVIMYSKDELAQADGWTSSFANIPALIQSISKETANLKTP